MLLVHGGPVPGQDLAAFERSARRLWIRDGFFAAQEPFPASDAWAPYRDAGIGRAVFGHTPVAEPTLYHSGRALNIDTWRGARVTLARIGTGPDLTDTVFWFEPAEPRAFADAPVTAEEIRQIDAALPDVVDAYWDAVKGPGA